MGLHKHQLLKRVVSAFLLTIVCLAALSPLSVSAQTTQQATNGAQQSTTCAVEKIGWIVCPIMEGASNLADKTFNMLASAFLEIDAELISSDAKGTKKAWEQARNLANVMFIIAFLAIIYSQITGSGLNNYGIKRMLPRLIIAAIAVNVSYYICQGLVDISNILGYEIKRALDDIANSIGPSVLGQSSAQGGTANTETSGGLLRLITYAALGVAGVAWFFLSIGTGIITLVFITAITIIIILLMRKAFIVLLVVVSPVAFVMYLLPNTEKFFQKWLSMFWKLLMVFPIVALLFGAGHLASTIILVAGASTNSGSATTQSKEECVANANKRTQEQRDQDGYSIIPCEEKITIGNQQSTWSLGLIAMGVAVAPLLAVWAVLKGALAAGGAIAGKVGGAIAKGTGSSIKGVQGAVGKPTAGWIASKTAGGGRFARGTGRVLTGNVGIGGGRSLSSMAAKREKDATEDTMATWTRSGKLGDKAFLNDQIRKNGVRSIEGQAALRQLAQTEDVDSLVAIQQDRNNQDDKSQAAIQRAIASNYSGLKAKDPRSVAKGGQVKWEEFSAAKISNMKDGAIQAGIQSGNPAFRQNLQAALGDSRLNTNFSNAQRWRDALAAPAQAPPRQVFNAGIAPGPNGQAFRRAQGQGGVGSLSNDDLIRAAREASRGANVGSAQHEDVADQIVREMETRYRNGDRSMDPTQHFQ